MNPISLPAGVSRLLAVVLLLLLLGLTLWLVLAPLLGVFYDMQDQRSNLEIQLERTERLVSRLSPLRAQLEEIHAGDPNRVFWMAETPSLAAAAMQTLVLQSASASQVKVTTAQTLPFIMDQELERISVAVDLTANLYGLQQLLYALENHMPALFIHSLTIRSQNQGVTQIDTPSEPALDVRVEMIGYRLPPQG